MLSGDNSILQRATDAKTKSNEAQIRERIQLAYHSALTKDITEKNGKLTMPTLQTELNNEFVGKTVTITPSADNKEWTIKVDNVEETVPAGKYTPQVASKLSDAEKTALQTNGISEITGDDISNDNLKENSRIKAVITGDVPLTTEMTYVTGTKDTGVVVSIDDNEFVWVPVPVAITSSAPSTTGVDLKANSSTERPMAILQSGSETNYQGVLYDFSGTTSTAKSIASVTFSYDSSEPRLIDYGDEDETVRDSWEGITLTELQSEYNNMVTSVNKYGGFYVARYELGLEGTIPVSKPASETVTTAGDGYQWYALYEKTKSMYRESESQNVVSQMIWGSQYDAMMNWMAKTEKTVGTADGDKYNQETTTGSKAEDIINNVKDLYGCYYEWTQEAISYYYRVLRGGSCSNVRSPASRDTEIPSYGGSAFASSRSTLYIKE